MWAWIYTCVCIGMMLKLKLQYFGHLMQGVDSLEKTLMLGGIGGRRKRGRQRMRWRMASPTRWTWVWVKSGVGDGQGGLECCDSWGSKELDTTEQLNWTEVNWCIGKIWKQIQQSLKSEYLHVLNFKWFWIIFCSILFLIVLLDEYILLTWSIYRRKQFPDLKGRNNLLTFIIRFLISWRIFPRFFFSFFFLLWLACSQVLHIYYFSFFFSYTI